MLRHSRIITIFILSALLLTACNSKPDHRRYIPKDAAVVTSINLSSLSKKIAWNMITNSKLFKEMEKRVPKQSGSDVMSGIDKAGIDVMNTFYVYLKADNRFNAGLKVTALIPLTDADAWEAYLKKNFPQAAVQEHNKLKVTSLDGNMYLGWDKNLLIIMNVLSDNSNDMTAEIDNAFGIADDNSIKANKNFEKLVGAGHDLALWVNYDQILNSYNERMSQSMGGVSLSNSLWKETAFSCGFDFVKGKITGDMLYYTPENMEGVYKKFAAENVSKDMIARLPGKDLDVMLATHLSIKGIKDMMDSTGFLGHANTELGKQGTDVDKILEAFTGDMAFTINALSVSSTAPTTTVPYSVQTMEYCMSYVVKLNKKESFDKLMGFARQSQDILPTAEGLVLPISAHDSVYMVSNNEYAVFSNKYKNAVNILHGSNKGSDAIAESVSSKATGHPFAMFVDIQETMRMIDLTNTIPAEGAGIYEQSKKLLTNISFSGGEYKDNAMQAHLEINFANKDESSIITLLDYGMKISDAMGKMGETQAPNADSTLQAL